jgi:hypothetical protein
MSLLLTRHVIVAVVIHDVSHNHVCYGKLGLALIIANLVSGTKLLEVVT